MLSTSPAPPSPRTGAAAALHQLYVTYCLHGEGVLPGAGLAVRASSTTDPVLLRFAAEYPPLEAAAQEHGTPGAPVRLALVRVPGGQTALIHSVPLAAAGGPAPTSFPHVLAGPALMTREALATWSSRDWMTACPPFAEKDLQPYPALPRPGPLS